MIGLDRPVQLTFDKRCVIDSCGVLACLLPLLNPDPVAALREEKSMTIRPAPSVAQRVSGPLIDVGPRVVEQFALAVERLSLALVLAVFGAMLLAPLAVAQPAALVFVDPVRKQPLDQTVPVIGRLVACRAGVVAARVSGPITEMAVDVGDRVAEGQVLAAIMQDRYAADLDLRAARVVEAKATVEAMMAQTSLRRQELVRLERLRRSPAFNEGQFEDKRQEVAIAESDLARARAALTSAEAELRLAHISLDDTKVRAPYAGVVSRRFTEIGAHVEAGSDVVALVDDRCVEIEADVPASRIGGLKPETRVAFTLTDTERTRPSSGDSSGYATVRAVVPEENPMTRTRLARFAPERVEMPNLAAGQSVVLQIPLGSARTIVTVHKDAVLSRRTGRVVFVATDGKAQPRQVQLGVAAGDRFEVLDGLETGDLAVIRGNERLRPGQDVRIGGPGGAPATDTDRAPDRSGSSRQSAARAAG